MRDNYAIELCAIYFLLMFGILFDSVSFILAVTMFYMCWGIASMAQSLSEINNKLKKKK